MTAKTAADYSKTLNYPRLRFMGSKFKMIPHLHQALSSIQYESALDAFSGSGVVSYYFKEQGKKVTSNDFLKFTSTISRALIENNFENLTLEDIKKILQPNKDGRHFIYDTFKDLYFPNEDHIFLDSAWSNLELLPDYKQAIAISALCLAAARKQPRGVFTITDFRYDDGRKALRLPLKDLFIQAAHEYNIAIFDNGQKNRSMRSDIFNIDEDDFDLVYLDPPYAPPSDDADYIKRYHFLEGLSVYWKNMYLMENTKTKKIEKIYTPFAYKKSICEALQNTIHKFRKSIIVLSYSSNSIPDESEILRLLRTEKRDIEIIRIPYKYSFGTHKSAIQRQTNELLFIAK